MSYHTCICVFNFIALYLTRSKKQNQTKCLPTNKENIPYITMEIYLTANKNEIMKPTLKWKEHVPLYS